MALWYLCTLLFTIFSGLYFAYDPQRFSPTEDKFSQVAGLFDSCRKGAALQATVTPAFLTGTGSVACNSASLPATAAQGLNVPGVQIKIVPGSLVDPALTTQRLVITYIPPGAMVMGSIPQLKAKKQIFDTFRTEVNTGNVEAGVGMPPHNIIQAGSREHGRVPAGPTGIPINSVANVQVIP